MDARSKIDNITTSKGIQMRSVRRGKEKGIGRREGGQDEMR